ncbi:hypothetical protein QFZ91_005287 [Paraburkholderia sp. JPY419]
MCGQRPVVCFPAVLLPCVISNTYHIDISRPDTLTATEPEMVLGPNYILVYRVLKRAGIIEIVRIVGARQDYPKGKRK